MSYFHFDAHLKVQIKTIINLTLNIQLVSELNVRMHWGSRARLAKTQRRLVNEALNDFDQPILHEKTRVIVTITRYASRLLDEHDNLRASAKHVIDEIAEWLGVDDSDTRLKFNYVQVKSNLKEKKLTTQRGIRMLRDVYVERCGILIQLEASDELTQR